MLEKMADVAATGQPKKLGTVEISLIVVFGVVFLAVIITIIVVFTLPKGSKIVSGSGGPVVPTRTVYLTSQMISGDSVMPTKIKSAQFSEFNTPVTWQESNPNNLVWLVTNATHQTYFTITGTQYQNVDDDPDVSGEISVTKGSGLGSALLDFGIIGFGFDPDTTKPLDPDIPVTFIQNVGTVTSTGTKNITIPELSGSTSDYLIFGQNCSGSSIHTLLVCNSGVFVSNTEIQIGYLHEPPGTVDPGTALFGFFITRVKQTVSFGRPLVWADVVTVSDGGTGSRIVSVGLPVSIDNTLGDNVWWCFSNDPSTTVGTVRQVNSNTLEVLVEAAAIWTANFACFKGGILADQFTIGP